MYLLLEASVLLSPTRFLSCIQTFIPLVPRAHLLFSKLFSNCSLLSQLITMSSVNFIVYGRGLQISTLEPHLVLRLALWSFDQKLRLILLFFLNPQQKKMASFSSFSVHLFTNMCLKLTNARSKTNRFHHVSSLLTTSIIQLSVLKYDIFFSNPSGILWRPVRQVAENKYDELIKWQWKFKKIYNPCLFVIVKYKNNWMSLLYIFNW